MNTIRLTAPPPAPQQRRVLPLAPLLALLATAWLGGGCASVKPGFPTVSADTPSSVLKLENQMSTSALALQWKAPVGLKLELDGFSALDGSKLSSGGKFGPKQFLPKGVSEIRVPAGNHTLTHQGQLLGNSVYHFKPVAMAFDAEAGKTYLIRFKQGGSVMKPGYLIEYEGWSTEQSAQWTTDSRIANPLFR